MFLCHGATPYKVFNHTAGNKGLVLIAQQNGCNDAGSHCNQHKIIPNPDPMMSSGRLSQTIAPPVVNPVTVPAVMRGQISARLEMGCRSVGMRPPPGMVFVGPGMWPVRWPPLMAPVLVLPRRVVPSWAAAVRVRPRRSNLPGQHRHSDQRTCNAFHLHHQSPVVFKSTDLP